MRVRISQLAGSRNIWPLASGEVAVRPGLRKVFTPSGGNVVVGGFSIENPLTLDVWHYIAQRTTTTGDTVKIYVYDEEFTELIVYDTGADAWPRVITHGVTNNEVFIASPDFPTVWGLVGSGLVRATKIESDSGQSVINVPRGVCAAWASRAVIAEGNAVYFSDPVVVQGGSPRTFIGANQWPFEATIYDLHVSDSGRLVVCTSKGVWALDAEASTAGQVPAPAWYQLSDYKAIDHGCTAMVHGRLFGLTRKGYRLIDGSGSEEIPIDDPHVPLSVWPRIAIGDYRQERMFASEDGPVVCAQGAAAFHRTDLSSGTQAWWTMTHSGEDAQVQGWLRDRYGEEYVLTKTGAYFIGGNFDGDETMAENAEAVTGGFFGEVPMPPEASFTFTRLVVGADTASFLYGSIRGSQVKEQAESSISLSSNADDERLGHVIGTDTWDDANVLWSEQPLRSVDFDLAVSTDDVTIEMAADRPLSRFSFDLLIEDETGEARRVDK